MSRGDTIRRLRTARDWSQEELARQVYARMDKDNYRQILAAVRAQTGREIEEIIEQ